MLGVLIFIGACGSEDLQGIGPGNNVNPVGGKAEEWNDINDPSRFAVEFEYELDKLPLEGEAKQIPWPDTYWPTYKDSTNHRWQGTTELSPLEKYDLAFNDWTPPEGFMDLRPFAAESCASGQTAEGQYDQAYYDGLGPAANYQSRYKGNRKARNGIDDDGDGQTDECDDNDGVEGWWGLCHAWTPAAILEKEPSQAVTYNGVTFEVGDLKALLMTIYDRSSAIILGDRCNEKDVERDENGRLIPVQCRDSNAGSFHVVASNMLGRYKRAFAEDRTFDYQVWNQPVRSFSVLSLEEVTASQAMEALGQESETYTYNPQAVRFAKVQSKLGYISEPRYTAKYPLLPYIDQYTRYDYYDYILEMDAAGKIIGGEWIGTSKSRHPDFLWLPLKANGGANPFVKLEDVRNLVEMSVNPPTP